MNPVSEYSTPVFQRLKEEKQTRILDTAALEFAHQGYVTANINHIARKAGVSVGALYKYFTTKENLFLAVCSRSVGSLSAALDRISGSGEDLFGKIEAILRLILEHSRANREMIILYQEFTTQGNRELAARLSFQAESLSARYYAGLLAQAREEGVIAGDVDERMFAFCLDNLFMGLQFSYASEYYRNRMAIYVDPEIFLDDDRVIRETLRFIRRALLPEPRP